MRDIEKRAARSNTAIDEEPRIKTVKVSKYVEGVTGKIQSILRGSSGTNVEGKHAPDNADRKQVCFHPHLPLLDMPGQ